MACPTCGQEQVLFDSWEHGWDWNWHVAEHGALTSEGYPLTEEELAQDWRPPAAPLPALEDLTCYACAARTMGLWVQIYVTNTFEDFKSECDEYPLPDNLTKGRSLDQVWNDMFGAIEIRMTCSSCGKVAEAGYETA
jgi:hypothetical protein